MELNSYLCRSARAMRDFHEALGNAGKVEEYERRLRDIRVRGKKREIDVYA